MKSILLAIASTLLCFCAQTQTVDDTVRGPSIDSLQIELVNEKKAVAERFANVKLEALVINVENNQYGYYIFADGQLIIEQKTIPAIPGNTGFVSKAEAQRTADYAITKIKKGEMPPTLTLEELKELNITGLH